MVSICIPTYNGGKYLKESLDSIKSQTYKDIEVIISDDNSIDNTLEICDRFKEEVNFPVHIYNHKPMGIGANWNNCIEKANGKYIKLFFQDDVLMPNCIEVMIDFLIRSKLHCVVSHRKIIDENSNDVFSGDWYNKYNDLQKEAGIRVNSFYILSKKNLKHYNFKRYSLENIIGEPCVSMFTKEMYFKIGPFNTSLKQILDYEYWLRVLIKYDIGIIGEKLVAFRYHEMQTSNINYNSGVRESKIITDFFYEKFLWHLDRKSRNGYLRKKYPFFSKLAAIKNYLLNQ